MSCTSGCPTQDCESYAACLRGKGVRVAYCDSANGSDLSRQKQWDRDLDAYEGALRQGINPAGCDRRSVDEAVAISNEAGAAWDSASRTFN